MTKKNFSVLFLSFFAALAVSAQSVGEVKIRTLGPANLNYRKSPKRVMISDFQVNYQTALNLKDSKKGGKMFRGGLKGSAKASLDLVLDGLDLEGLQKLTDQLYADYVSKLKAQGFEVAPIEELWNHDLYVKNREKRWELKSGNGPEKGKEFGMILMRPSSQKFVVAQRTMGKDDIPLAGFADYVSSVEGKLTNRKTDFIFNKVILEVIAFEDSQSETSKALNRHAGHAQVKAQTTFKIGEESQVMYGMGKFSPRGGGLEVSGVMERQKFNASQIPDTDKLGTDVGVFQVWRVEDREEAGYSIVKCDPEKYLKGAEIGLNAYLDATVQKLAGKSK